MKYKRPTNKTVNDSYHQGIKDGKRMIADEVYRYIIVKEFNLETIYRLVAFIKNQLK